MIYNRPEYWLARTETVASYLTFSSPNSFTLATGDATKRWDGTLEYSTDTSTWSTWDGTTTLSSAISGSDNVLYLRGIRNTKIGCFDENKHKFISWVINGTDVRCDGNIETLLDYATVEVGQHPTMTNYCYTGMFYGCTALTTAPTLPATTLATMCYGFMFYGCSSLIQAPALPATTLATMCYSNMFYECSSLIQAPALPATTLASGCYANMFRDCSSLKLSSTQTGEYMVAYRIPSAGTGVTATDALTDMFTSTGGTFASTPKINTMYYLSNTNAIV